MAKQAATQAQQQPIPPLLAAPTPSAPYPQEKPIPSTISAPGASITPPLSEDVQPKTPERTALIPPPDAPKPQAAPMAVSNIGRGTTQGDQAEQSRLLNTGSGISQIHSKIENSGFGQAHPILGKILGWGAQIPAQIADIAGASVAPMIDVNTPGTEMHHDRLVNQAQRQVGQDVANDERQAQTAQANEQTAAIPESQQLQHEQ